MRWHRDVKRIAAEHGFDNARLEHGGKHLKLVLGDRKITVSNTPSDVNALKQVGRDIRRAAKPVPPNVVVAPTSDIEAPTIVPAMVEAPVVEAPAIVPATPKVPDVLYHFTTSAHLPWIIGDGALTLPPTNALERTFGRDYLYATSSPNGDKCSTAWTGYTDTYREGISLRVRFAFPGDGWRPWREVLEESGQQYYIKGLPMYAAHCGENPDNWFLRWEPLSLDDCYAAHCRAYTSHRWVELNSIDLSDAAVIGFTIPANARVLTRDAGKQFELADGRTVFFGVHFGRRIYFANRQDYPEGFVGYCPAMADETLLDVVTPLKAGAH